MRLERVILAPEWRNRAMLGYLSVVALATALGWSSPATAQGAQPNQPDQQRQGMMCPCCQMMMGDMMRNMMQQHHPQPASARCAGGATAMTALTRRSVLVGLAIAGGGARAADQLPKLTVTKDPTCGCC